MEQAGQWVFSSEHSFYYNTDEPVPIAEVIESLIGVQKLLRSLPKALENATGVPIAESQVFVEQLESGSLLERVVVRLFFRSEEDLNEFLDKVRAKMDGAPVLKVAVISAMIAGLFGYGMLLAAKSLQTPAPNITANNNVIINIGAGEVGVSQDEFRALIESSVADKKDLARAVVRMVQPAKADRKASIVLDDRDDLAIDSSAVAEVPDAVHIEPQTEVVEHERVTLLIRAGDMDQAKSGWAGAIQGLTERLPIELDPAISPVQLFGRQKKEVVADVAITYRLDGRSRKMVPRSIFVRKLHG